MNMKVFFLLLLFFNAFKVNSQDLTRQNHITKTLYLKGNIGEKHFFEPSLLTFDTGKLYKLVIKNTSDSKHYFSSNEFSKPIFTRKVQIIKDGEKISEVKGNIFEIELFPQNVVEWWFVPIKTGEFDDLNCTVIDPITKKSHSNMGMIGKIVIE